MMRRGLLVILPCLVALSMPGASPGDNHLLWQIGAPDRSNLDLALAPNHYSQFTDDAFFIVGQSEPKRDWPYVQPGPADTWAGGREHQFLIIFGLSQISTKGQCELVIDLIDTHQRGPPNLRIEVNGAPFERQLPPGGGDASLEGDPSRGKPCHLAVNFPSSLLKSGNNEIAITTESGSWMLYDSVALQAPAAFQSAPAIPGVALRAIHPAPALLERSGKMFEPVTFSLCSIGPSREVTAELNGVETGRFQLTNGPQTLETLFPEVKAETHATFALVAGGKTLADKDIALKPVRHWDVYILMHSHNDIGYTDLQPNIARKQAHNVERALELTRQNGQYPPGARFKWNLEVFWPADQFYAIATSEQKRQFEQAVHDGYIGVDAMYGNLLTGLCRYEELVRQAGFALELGQRCGRPVDSMMISDVPGLTWGLVPALASQGIKYFSAGPNASRTMAGDRIGYVRVQWENHPFYWLSPSGQERVLYWGAQGGYSFGHHFRSLMEGLPFLLNRLEEQNYAYDMVQLRWTKGDNGPPDEGVMPAVRDWNAKYAWPRLTIATTSEAFHAFEKRYGAQLPVFRGDLTPYWEDGAPSSARETALNRHSADRLVQAETLWALRQPGKFPAAEFAAAWKNVALYSEHTWGAYNSISQPDLPFVREQWKYKQGYALAADSQSWQLLCQALGCDPGQVSTSIDVWNTTSWARTDLVTLPKETLGDAVKDEAGHPVASQRLSTGQSNLPPWWSAHSNPAMMGKPSSCAS